MSQIVQIAGALCVLAGFVLAQVRILDPQRIPYLALNLIGSAILAVLALLDRQWGFLLLEGVWALVSLIAILRYSSRRDASTGTTGANH